MTAQCRNWLEQVALHIYMGGTLAILGFAALYRLTAG